ncbi:MAG TPA: CoA pyrophosphatase, partial [Longimicrobiales bacterium]|nr:CoA pyrophosphatase [Longimicrobiales bacterium]
MTPSAQDPLADARLAALRRALARLAPPPAPPRELEAAVALLLRPGTDLDVLLIRRARHDSDPWSGHVALPGGRRDPADTDLSATARRETLEEVGLDLDRIGRQLGRLQPVAPASPRLPSLSITPYVFAVEPGHELTLDEREVDAAVWVPLAELHDERAAGEILIEIEGGAHRFPSLTYGDY